MRLLVMGGAGMLGHKLCQVAGKSMEVHATFCHQPSGNMSMFLPAERMHGSVFAERFETVEAALDQVKPDAVVNCIGVVKQREAGKDPITSITVNALFPHLLARACQKRDIRIITISSDCVFSGRKGGYKEEEPSDGEDLYGRTKALGEVMGSHCLTLRTSMIGRELSGQQGLVEWLLSQAGQCVKGYRHAVFSGLTTLELSRVIVKIMEHEPLLSGLYHVSSAPITKYDLLHLINERYALNISIEPDDQSACDRSLNGSHFRETTGYVVPPWPDLIREMYEDPTPYEEIRAKK
ncbi:MAG: SDR family oxidoreductase [bacterium]